MIIVMKREREKRYIKGKERAREKEEIGNLQRLE